MSTGRNAWKSVANFEAHELKVQVEAKGLVLLQGLLTLREPSRDLLPVFKALHEAAIADGLDKVVLDVSGLTFVNSSGIRTFVDWVLWVRDEPATRRYALTFRSNREHAWQRASLPVIQSLAPASVHIER